jgi:choline dehydrogenase-like flavoprotein
MIITYDYVIVGGGSAGCVLASRLSENPNISVCLIEPGGHGNNTMINTPAAMVAMLPTRLHNWALQTTPQPGLNGRQGYQPRGKALGGSSAMSAMIYLRGQKQDYDAWAQAGNKGWSYNELLPYFKRGEHNERGECVFHGDMGPQYVSEQRSGNPYNDIFLHAAAQCGHNMNPDFNSTTQEGFGVYQVTQHEGRRCSAAHAYLNASVIRRSNLKIEIHSRARRILIAGRSAYGVQVENNGFVGHYVARKEVILSAGTFHSPQLLMLSGIGARRPLLDVGIECINELPGVGQNLHDHIDFVFGYKLHDTRLMGASLRALPGLLRALFQYHSTSDGPLASNYAETGGFFKTHCDLNEPNMQAIFVNAFLEDHGRKMHWGHGYSCHSVLLQPKSRGHIRLKSASIDDAPIIDPNFLSHPNDMAQMVAGFKAIRSILRAPALAKLGARDMFTEGIESDEAIEQVIRQRADSEYHPVGTCRMGSDKMAVVNDELQVHGIRGLRVVDASVMPRITSGGTNAPTMMIAEKAASMIARDALRFS